MIKLSNPKTVSRSQTRSMAAEVVLMVTSIHCIDNMPPHGIDKYILQENSRKDKGEFFASRGMTESTPHLRLGKCGVQT